MSYLRMSKMFVQTCMHTVHAECVYMCAYCMCSVEGIFNKVVSSKLWMLVGLLSDSVARVKPTVIQCGPHMGPKWTRLLGCT